MMLTMRGPAWAMGALLGLAGTALAEDAPAEHAPIKLEARLLGFDADKNGSLDADELDAFAQSVPKDDALQTFVGFLVALGGASDATVDRIASFDQDKDGKINASELPDRFRVLIEKGDDDKDGALSSHEVKAMAEDMGVLNLPRDLLLELNGRGTPQTAERVLRLDSDRDGKVSRAELVAPVLAMFDAADADKDGALDAVEIKAIDDAHDRTGLPLDFNDLDGRSADRGGVANVERLLAFDLDRDGRLTKVELLGRKHDLLDRLDANYDGILDRAELDKWERREALVAALQTRRGSDAPSAFEQALAKGSFREGEKTQAAAILKTYRESVRKQPTETRAALVAKLEQVLGADAYQAFQAEVVENLAKRGGGFNGQYIPAAKVVQRLLTFDNDGDGRLSKAELDAMPDRLAHVQRVQDAHHAQRRAVVTESSTDRLKSFDADKDGKVTRAELPERLHALLVAGDADKDEALNAVELAIIGNRESFDRFVQGAVGGVNLALIDQAAKDQKDETARNKALDALADYRASVRSSAEQARVELQARLDGVLGSAELNALQDSLAGENAAR